MIAKAKAALNKKNALFTSKLDLNLRTKSVVCCILEDSLVWCRDLDTSEIRPEIPGNFCWKRMEKISWTDRVSNEVLQRVKEERNILQRIIRRKANWIGHILPRNCLMKHVIEGKIEGRIDGGEERKKK